MLPASHELSGLFCIESRKLGSVIRGSSLKYSSFDIRRGVNTELRTSTAQQWNVTCRVTQECNLTDALFSEWKCWCPVVTVRLNLTFGLGVRLHGAFLLGVNLREPLHLGVKRQVPLVTQSETSRTSSSRSETSHIPSCRSRTSRAPCSYRETSRALSC
jgi:hypothetical protein